MDHIKMDFASGGALAPVIDSRESNYYATEAERESLALSTWAQEACGPCSWKRLGNWLLARTCLASLAARVFGTESSLLVLLVQAWASRVHTSLHLATNSEMSYVEECVFLMVRTLRYVAPDAVRRAMRNDA